jgi:transcriptional regulator with PAS, ATPase and Fis domain
VSSVSQSIDRISVRRDSNDRLHHHCPPTDARSSSQKKEMQEKIKRKEYELKTLKNDLKTKNSELSSLSSRLNISETSHFDKQSN